MADTLLIPPRSLLLLVVQGAACASLLLAPGCSGGGPPEVVPRFGAPADTTRGLSRTVFLLDELDGLKEPVDLAVDPSNRLLVLDAAGPDLIVFDERGRREDRWPVSGASAERFFRPARVTTTGLAILLMDPDERVVHRYDMRGQYQGVALDLDLVASSGGGFIQPVDLAADNAGQLFITEREGHRVLAFDQSARLLFSFGGFGTGDGQLRSPGAITVDARGVLIVADQGNGRLQAFDGFGTPLGSIALPPAPDGRPPRPVAVAITPGRATLVADARGRLYSFAPWYGADARESVRARFTHALDGLSALAVHPSARIFCLSSARARVEAIELGGR